jgi:hypothetical protein
VTLGSEDQVLSRDATSDGTEWATIASGITIGDTITGGSANRILFEDGSTQVAQSAGFVFDGAQLGINNATPAAMLDIQTNATDAVGATIQATAGQTANLFQALDSVGTVGAHINAATEFSNTGGQSRSEVFGAGAAAGNIKDVIIGYGATASRFEDVVVGCDASAAGIRNVVVGTEASQAGSSHSGCVAVGYDATTTSSLAVSIGGYSQAGGGYDCAIGSYANASFDGGKAVGYDATTTAAYQFVSGSHTAPTNDIYFGKGVTHATPTAYTIHGTANTTTDGDGADIRLVGGLKNGTGSDGNVILCHDGTNQLGNVAVGTETLDGSIANGITIANGTAPSGGVTDAAQLYSADQTAGNACLHAVTELGDVIKLYKTATGYTTFSNLSTDRTCDANSTTVEELADILGTLIEDLKNTGLIAA